jgi:hypothetical protein
MAMLATACAGGDGTEQSAGASSPRSSADASALTTAPIEQPTVVDSPDGGSSSGSPPGDGATALSVSVGAQAPAAAAAESDTTTTTGSTGQTTAPATTVGGAESDTTVTSGGASPGQSETVRIRFESQVADVTDDEFRTTALAILNDPRGWTQAGFSFVADDDGPYRVVLAEGPAVDQLCLPLETFGTVSCQNGPVVALNADRWRGAVDHWELGVDVYRGYLVNHEVGHLIGQRHPKPRCPVPGRPAGVMEQQTAGLEGCIGNPWPRDWELAYARQRPVVYAPLPDWGPDPVPTNGES